jgi:hypothetical protein
MIRDGQLLRVVVGLLGDVLRSSGGCCRLKINLGKLIMQVDVGLVDGLLHKKRHLPMPSKKPLTGFLKVDSIVI